MEWAPVIEDREGVGREPNSNSEITEIWILILDLWIISNIHDIGQLIRTCQASDASCAAGKIIFALQGYGEN